jgi:hypothetical protein
VLHVFTLLVPELKNCNKVLLGGDCPGQNVASSHLHFSTPSISKPLALGVDPKIKAKIWAQEYIDLGHLLNKNVSKVRFHAV